MATSTCPTLDFRLKFKVICCSSSFICASTEDMSDLRQRRPLGPPNSAKQAPTDKPESSNSGKRTKKPPQSDSTLSHIISMLPFVAGLYILYYLLNRSAPDRAGSRSLRVKELDGAYAEGKAAGHWDFGDGRANQVGEVWRAGCEGCYWVNTMLGNGGWVFFLLYNGPFVLCLH